MNKTAKYAGLALVVVAICGALGTVLLDEGQSIDTPGRTDKVKRDNQGAGGKGRVQVFDPTNLVTSSQNTSGTTSQPDSAVAAKVPETKPELPSDQVLIVVFGADGKELSGAVVKARTQSRSLKLLQTEADGRAFYEGLETNSQFYAQVWHPRYKSARAIGPLRTGTKFELQFPDESSGQIEFECVDDLGDPVANATITVTNTSVGLRATLTESSLKSQDLAELGLGRVSLFAKADNYAQSATLWATPESAKSQRLKFVLPRLGTLQGQMIGLTGSGTEVVIECDATIGKRPYTRIETFERTLPLDGRQFTASSLVPGDYRIRAYVKSDRSQGTEWLKLKILSGVDTQFDFPIKQLQLSCAGIIEDDRGQPIEGAKILCHVSSATTDNRGEFQFFGLPNGVQRLTISAPGFATRAVSVAVVPGKVQRHKIVLSSYGSISGKVVNSDGVPQPGTKIHLVQLENGREGEIISLNADKRGQFVFKDIRPGSYFFVVANELPRYSPDKVVVSVVAGKEVRLPLTYDE